jgi:gliding motility-associated-like protein
MERTRNIAQHALANVAWVHLALVLGFFLSLAHRVDAQEICDNGIDDTGNGLIDLNDVTACPCDTVPLQTNLIQNPSFEIQNCCPTGTSQNPNVFLPCATGWSDYMNTATADYFNTCGFMPMAVPAPLPDGNAAAGFLMASWPGGNSAYEVLSQCLQAPMQAGQTYELRFNVASVRVSLSPLVAMGFTLPINYGPVDLTLYGLASCPTLPYAPGGPADICPVAFGWTELGQVNYTPVHAWQELGFSFQAPFDVQAIMFGPPCPTPTDYTMGNQSTPYFFVDDFSLEASVVGVEAEGSICTNDLVLTAVPYDPGTAQYQWYRNGVALVGEVGETLDVSGLALGEASYQIRVVNNGDCMVASYDAEVEWPIPSLVATPTSGCAPLEVDLTNTTTTPIGTSSWDLGDGTVASSTDVLHTYTEPGIYDVGLTITTPEGCTIDTLFVGLIEVFAVPLASLAADTLIGCPGLEVTFMNTSQTSAGLDCLWDLGDGGVLSDCSGSHFYMTSGVYDVRLTVTTPEGCSDDTLMTGLIEILPVPEPAFSIEPSSGCVPLLVRFENQTPDASSQSTFWDLGNGGTSTSTNAITTYTDPGQYSVSLTMTNSIGCSATLTYADTITAYGLPEVLFSVLPDSGCAPLFVEFLNATDPAMVGSCAWDFGDGATSGSCNVTHRYEQPGAYTVSLHVSSPANCEGDTTVFHLVHVFPSPTAQFTIGPQPTDLYATELEFTDGSSSDVVAWDWFFPSATPSSSTIPGPSVTYPYGESGSYPTTLIVTNGYGCVDTATAFVRIDGVFSVYVPNTFSPNGDGVNDVFIPIIRDASLRDYSFLVFDRWGQEIFASTSIGESWDGHVNGAEPKTDVYAWRLRVRSDVDAMMREYMGHVTVLR